MVVGKKLLREFDRGWGGGVTNLAAANDMYPPDSLGYKNSIISHGNLYRAE